MDPVLNGPEIYKYKGCVSEDNTMYVDHMIRNRNTTKQKLIQWDGSYTCTSVKPTVGLIYLLVSLAPRPLPDFISQP